MGQNRLPMPPAMITQYLFESICSSCLIVLQIKHNFSGTQNLTGLKNVYKLFFLPLWRMIRRIRDIEKIRI